MWLNLGEADVDFTEGGQKDRGVVKNYLLDPIRAKVEKQKGRVRSFLAEHKDQMHFINELTTTMDMCLTRISTTSSSLRELQRGFSEVQRSFLTIKAIIDFHRQYHRIQNTSVQANVDTTKMGCFVWDDRDASMLYKMGFPVFLIRPWSRFDRQLVLKIEALTRPIPPAVETAPADPPYPPIVTTQAGSDVKYGAIRTASIQCFATPSPFANIHLPGAYASSYQVGQGRIYAPTSSPASSSNVANAVPSRGGPAHGGPARHRDAHASSRGARQTRNYGSGRGSHVPKNPRKCPGFSASCCILISVSSAKVQRNAFDDFPPDDPFVPPYIEAWKAVNTTIKREGVTVQKKLLPVPDPGLFFGTAERQHDFFHQWNHLRPFWLKSLENGRTAQTLEMWRKVLAYKFLKPLEDGAFMTAKKQTAEDARSLVEKTIQTYNTDVPYVPPSNGPFDHTLGQFLIRELCMMNFRAELLYVDGLNDQTRPQPSLALPGEEFDRKHALHQRDRQTLVDGCFGGLAAVPIDELNMGIAATDWLERYAALKCFWSLLNTWGGAKPEIWRRGIDMDLSKLQSVGQQWERMLAEFYVQNAFNVLGHPPSLPRRIRAK